MPFFGLLLGIPLPLLAQEEHPHDEVLKNIERTVKRNILEDYRHGDTQAFWSMFAPDAIFVDGRMRTPDRHDLTRTRTQEKGRRDILARAPEDPQRDVFFRHVKGTEENGKFIIKMELVFHYFGGQRHEGHIYSVESNPQKWEIQHTRRWVIHEAMGPDIRTFDDLYFKHADEDAQNALNNEALEMHTRLTRLIRAKWMFAAFELAKARTKQTPKSAEAWRALGALAEVGEPHCRSAPFRALKLNPGIVVPTLLKP